jgi:hypothetical protein
MLALAVEIVSRIESGEWTATQVLEAYISRAAFAHAKTNCLTEGKALNTLLKILERSFCVCSYVGAC